MVVDGRDDEGFLEPTKLKSERRVEEKEERLSSRGRLVGRTGPRRTNMIGEKTLSSRRGVNRSGERHSNSSERRHLVILHQPMCRLFLRINVARPIAVILCRVDDVLRNDASEILPSSSRVMTMILFSS